MDPLRLLSRQACILVVGSGLRIRLFMPCELTPFWSAR